MASRGRARGRGAPTGPGRGASSSRGRGLSNGGRGNAGITRSIARTNGLPKHNSRNDATSSGSWPERYEKLERARKGERIAAIKNGEMQDPDKPRALAEAITPTGTCPDMCPEFERVQRVVQKDVWAEEADPTKPAHTTADREPDEARMVKKFRRSAAGIEEQLPSDLRPPYVLQRTCDYLFNEVIGDAPDLAKVHHFVWDRTRAIRNDFSIQQIRDAEGLRIAVDCHERIVRFHILSLHQLAQEEPPYDRYDAQQEQEQLDRTLSSLMQYYDDSRAKIDLPNESEFRAYLIIFQLRAQIPDLEDRVQTWPIHITRHPRIRKALKLYAAACNTKDVQGPLNPPTSHLIAQQDWQRFWNLISSTRTSYLAACVAEIYFNMIRSMALQGLLRASNKQVMASNYTVEDMCNMLAFDNKDYLEEFINCYSIKFTTGANNQVFVDFSALQGRLFLPSPSPELPKQLKTDLVEDKRFGRSFPAVISGMTVKQAQDAGMIIDEEMVDDEAMDEDAELPSTNGNLGDHAEESDEAANDGGSLFLPDTAKPKSNISTFPSSDEPPKSVFGPPSAAVKNTCTMFGQPTTASTTAPSAGSNPFAPAKADTSAQDPMKYDSFKHGKALGADDKSWNGPPVLHGPCLAPMTAAEVQAKPSPFSGFGKPAGEQAAKPSPFSGFGASSVTSGPMTEATSKLGMFGDIKPVSAYAAQDQPKETKSPFSFGQPASSASTTSVLDTASEPAQAPKTSTFSFMKPTEPSDTAPSSGFSTKPFCADSETKSLFATATPAAPAVLAPSFAPKQAEQPQTTSPQQPTFSFTSTAQVPAKVPEKPSAPTAPRRTSGIDFSSKPSKPSPLAQSFTFGGDGAASSSSNTQSQASRDNSKPPVVSNTPDLQSQAAHHKQAPFSANARTPASANRIPALQPDAESDSAIFDRIARNLTLEYTEGLLDQYVSFTVSNIITSVQEEIHFERIEAEAAAYRLQTLSVRYGRRWRDICHHKRLLRRGRDRRRRAQERLAESRSQADTNSLADTIRSRAESRVSSVLGRSESRHEQVDRMYQAHGMSRLLKESQARGGGVKRPTSSHGVSASPSTRANGHKRLKSTSHVDDGGRVAKPSPSRAAADTIQRASFLSSMTGMPPPPSATQTNYFRRKAAGHLALGDTILAPARKRTHAESTASHPPESPAPPPNSSIRDRPIAPARRSHERQSSSASARSASRQEDDDALLERVRKAREGLDESAAFLRSEVARMDTLRKSTDSQPDYESPSMNQARVEAGLRASQNASARTTPDVPAYRFRESRFVPREQYGKAIERSKEIREARSRGASTRQSPAQHESASHVNGVSQDYQAQSLEPETRISSKTAFQHDTQQAGFGQPTFGNGVSRSFVSQPSGIQAFRAPPAQATGSGFGSAFTSASSQQPFGQRAAEARPFAKFGSNHETTNGTSFDPSHSQWDDLQRAQPIGAQAGNSSLHLPPVDSQSQFFDTAETDMLVEEPTVDAQPGFAYSSQQSPAPAELDHTIQPPQIEDSLSASFGHGAPAIHQNGYQMQFAQDQGFMQPVAPPANNDSMLDLAGSDDELEVVNASGPYFDNAASAEVPESGDEGDVETAADAMLHSYGHVNPYAALANGDDEATEEDEELRSEDYEDEVQDSQWQGTQQHSQEQYPVLPENVYNQRADSYLHTYNEDELSSGDDDDEELENGDDEEESGDDEEEMYDEDDEEATEGEETYEEQERQFAPSATPGPGATETDAIELSD